MSFFDLFNTNPLPNSATVPSPPSATTPAPNSIPQENLQQSSSPNASEGNFVHTPAAGRYQGTARPQIDAVPRTMPQQAPARKRLRNRASNNHNHASDFVSSPPRSSPMKKDSHIHEWSKFETDTFLSLIARSIHLDGTSNHARLRKTDPHYHIRHRKNMHRNFATALNEALNGRDHNADIPIQDVVEMLDLILQSKMHVCGAGGLAERGPNRSTRTMRAAFERRGLDFHGGQGEWERGRMEEVMGSRYREVVLARRRRDKGKADAEKERVDRSKGAYTKSSKIYSSFRRW